MANEAVIVELMGQPSGVPIRFTCADGVGIEKGTLLWFSDNRTISGASVDCNLTGKAFAGIAATEKVASDGSTTIGVWTKGIFDLTSVAAAGTEGAIGAGHYVVLSGSNLIARLKDNATILSGAVIGKALEDASASEVIQVAIGVYS